MNTETLEKMKKMRMLGMHRTFQTSLQTPRPEGLTVDEMIAQLIDSEWDDRHNRAIDRSMKRAKFRYNATLENLDYAPERGIDKNQIHRFADGSFIKKNELSRHKSEQRPERFGLGDKVDAKIISLDTSSNKIALSIKAHEIEEEKRTIAEYGSADSGASLGDILGVALGKAATQEKVEKKPAKKAPIKKS